MRNQEYSSSENLCGLGVNQLWHQGLTGKGVGIGHLDTGVASHPALEGKVAGFMLFDDQGNPVPDHEPFDAGQHGTHTAGLICGGTMNGTPIGVAPEASLYSGAVIDGGQTILRILRGLCWLAEQPVRVVTLPLGIPGYHPVFREAVEILRGRGILPIAAIGNRGAGQFHSPGVYPNVLSVGATNGQGQIASFSGSRNNLQDHSAVKPDVLAPGKNIISLAPGAGTRKMSGTSMSSAYVAGIAALLFEACPNASVASMEAALIESSSPVDTHRSRAGQINALAALKYLPSSQPAQEEIPDETYAEAAKCENERFIDPHLSQQFFYKGESAILSAIIGSRGCFGDILSEVNNKIKEGPASIEQLHPTQMVWVRATVRWLRNLLAHEQVTLASDVDVDMATVLFG